MPPKRKSSSRSASGLPSPPSSSMVSAGSNAMTTAQEEAITKKEEIGKGSAARTVCLPIPYEHLTTVRYQAQFHPVVRSSNSATITAAGAQQTSSGANKQQPQQQSLIFDRYVPQRDLVHSVLDLSVDGVYSALRYCQVRIPPPHLQNQLLQTLIQKEMTLEDITMKNDEEHSSSGSIASCCLPKMVVELPPTAFNASTLLPQESEGSDSVVGCISGPKVHHDPFSMQMLRQRLGDGISSGGGSRVASLADVQRIFQQQLQSSEENITITKGGREVVPAAASGILGGGTKSTHQDLKKNATSSTTIPSFSMYTVSNAHIDSFSRLSSSEQMQLMHSVLYQRCFALQEVHDQTKNLWQNATEHTEQLKAVFSTF